MKKLNNWNFIDEVKPTKNGTYLVCWAEPYSKEMTQSTEYWFNDRFGHQFAGGNEILFWKELPEFPECDKDLRTRRCQRL